MSIVPTVIISNTAHGASNGGSYNGTDLDWYSTRYQGRGYYGYSDGYHTFGYKTTGLLGVVSIQATLATNPTEDDWFDTGSSFGDENTPYTGSNYTNVVGNFVWIRLAITNFTAGTINRVLYN